MSSIGRWTGVPREWSGRRLYDWGRAGLRSHGNGWIRAAGHRARKSFAFHVGTIGFAVLPCGGDRRLLYRVKALAPGEVWPVYERAGKWWARRYYIVPAAALQQAGRLLAGERAA